MRKDVASNKDMLQASEDKRLELQSRLAEASEKVKKASVEGVSQIQGLIAENQKICQDLEESRGQIGVKEQEHLSRLENVFQAHKLRTDSI